MPVPASQIFDFIDQSEGGTAERHEIASAAFGNLRRSLRQIVSRCFDPDDNRAVEVATGLRALLSEWLTVPVPFDGMMLESMKHWLGEPESVQACWGSDLRGLYDTALCAAEGLQAIENPVRERLRTMIRDLRTQGANIRVYCHRRAREHFESLMGPPDDYPFPDGTFLHSVKDYRETEPFDVLIKVGPLRSRGWGAAPDAILTAPRFGKLVQIVWMGCSDEVDFGYDPVSLETASATPEAAGEVIASATGRGSVKWTTQVIRFGNDPGALPGYVAEADELMVFRVLGQSPTQCAATLIQTDRRHGILYRPHTKVISFDPDPTARPPIAHRVPGETLVEGMFLINPCVGHVDLGELRAEHGHYSNIWRTRLEQERQRDAAGLIRRLREAGLDLVGLRSAINHWCEAPTTVIHAPQQMRHFEILVRVLGAGGDGSGRPTEARIPWWRPAWAEIRRSRGEAIQAGVEKVEIVEEHLLGVLQALLPQIRARSSAKVGFSIPIPAESGVAGQFLFDTVCAVEYGFRVPVSELGIIRELSVIDQWRD